MSTTAERAPRPRDVAIVGMACVMPGAPDVETFWSNIVDGVDSVGEVSPARWDTDIYFDPDYESSGRPSGEIAKSVSKWGGFVPDVAFDALAWGIPPASLASIDPAQLLALKVAGAALDDAGYGQREGQRDFDRDLASVIYATGSGGAPELQAGVAQRLAWPTYCRDPLPTDVDEYLPQVTEDGLPGALTSLISGRVANRLDFGGKNLTIDSACASVLVALEIACDELTASRSDLVLLGGVDLHNGAGDYVSFTAAHALSRTGRCHSFDADGDGMTLAEGCGCIVLRRLEDAQRDGDRIYAVVEGVRGSSDGRHLGLTAPRQEGQEKAVRRAYQQAGISPADIRLVEAHGTGTAAGDRTELKTMHQVFGEAGATQGSIVIGSVKSNIGHIKCASGIASLIKSAKAAYHGVLPPTLHIRRPNEAWDPGTSPFVFLDQARPWLDHEKLAGISGFGFGGTNFHAILSSPETADPDGPAVSDDPVRWASGRPHWPSEIFAIRAGSDAEAQAHLDELAARLDDELVEPRQADRVRLRDVAASICARGEGPVRLAIVADDLDDLAAKVTAARSGQDVAGVYRGDGAARSDEAPQVAFLFPGPDSARVGMASDLLVAFPALRSAAQVARQLTDVMLPPQAFEDHARQQAALAEVASPAVALASLTLASALVAFDVMPDRVVGCGSPLLSSAPAGELAQALHGSPAALASLATPSTPDDEAHFLSEVRQLSSTGVGVFVEVGPGRRLTELVQRAALTDVRHVAVAADQPGQHGVSSLLHALAQLAVAGVPVNLAALHVGRGSQPERWDDAGKRVGWIVNGQGTRTASGQYLPKGIRAAWDVPELRLVPVDAPDTPAAGNGSSSPAAPASANRAPLANGNGNGNGNGAHATGPTQEVSQDVTVVMEYLRTIHEIIATGSDIVRSRIDQGARDR